MTSVKFFVGEISHFSIVSDASETFQNLSDDLRIISECFYRWKMHLNLNMSKQAQKVIFSKKTKNQSHPLLTIGNRQSFTPKKNLD